MSEPFLGQITMFAGTFAPRGWAFCDGRLLPINSHQAVYSLLGTYYGGDGRTTFALPDLRGRTPRGSEGGSAGPGLPPVQQGERGGATSTTLTAANLPPHHHTQTVSTDDGSSEAPGISAKSGENTYRPTSAAGKLKNGALTTRTGGNEPLDHLNPYLGLNYIIALIGRFPSRN
ncbi:MAG: microcystin-dependent protein [Planctomycetaceae bacterium]|jgi:microcystin-dependent protein